MMPLPACAMPPLSGREHVLSWAALGRSPVRQHYGGVQSMKSSDVFSKRMSSEPKMGPTPEDPLEDVEF